MAITDIKAYAHLTDADVEALGQELEAIHRDIAESLGASDARYIRRSIKAQRVLEFGGRAVLFYSRNRVAWLAGTALLTVAKIIENMELGHNISHGQWDWMNDPEIHSSTWEWDMVGTSTQWKRGHNYSHHTYTNIVGMDEDLGFGIIRMTRDEPWRSYNALQPLANVLVAATFEWGIATHHWMVHRHLMGAPRFQLNTEADKAFARKILRQLVKDFVIYPAVTGPGWKSTLKANVSASVLRNLWMYVVIFCGHFPDGAEKFTLAQIEDETRGEWYLRQMLGSANFDAGPILGFMSGNLAYQIEHHMFPDLPSNRYPEIAERVRRLCDKYDLPYTTGSLAQQYLLAFRTIHKLALPDSMLRRTPDDAPETSSEHRFADRVLGVDPATGHRRGLRTALREAVETKKAALRARRRGAA